VSPDPSLRIWLTLVQWLTVAVCAGTLYTSAYGISAVGMIIAIAFGRITTIATQIDVVMSCHQHTALQTALNNTQKTCRVALRRRQKR
jgi:hypothetical protein